MERNILIFCFSNSCHLLSFLKATLFYSYCFSFIIVLLLLFPGIECQALIISRLVMINLHCFYSILVNHRSSCPAMTYCFPRDEFFGLHILYVNVQLTLNFSCKVPYPYCQPPRQNITKELCDVTDDIQHQMLVHMSTGIPATRSLI